MVGVRTKPREQIGLDDIHELINSRVPEGEHFEFKETLPGKGKHRDSWIRGKNNIGQEAKNKVLEEAVAFANAHGGVLLIGIKESDTEEPPFAAEITPLPRCAALVDRFSSIFSACVEPQIPSLEVFAVPTECDDDSGVLVIRVGRSRLAPHRVTTTRECTVRRRDRCEKLTMWEIQDMTLNTSRGMERFEGRLSDRSARFQDELNKLGPLDQAFGWRITALPVGEDVRLNHVFHGRELIARFDTRWRTVKNKTADGIDRTLDCQGHFDVKHWRPILRGARTEIHPPHQKNPRYVGYQELHCDGLIEIGYGERNLYFHRDLPVVLFANMLVWLNQIKCTLETPIVEYGLEVELSHHGRPVHVVSDLRLNLEDLINYLSKSDPEKLNEDYPQISNVKFPRYALEGEDTNPNNLLTMFWQDFQHSLGRYDDSDAVFEISEQ